MRRSLRPLAATLVALLMLAAVVAVAWMAIASGVLSASSASAGVRDPAPAPRAESTSIEPAAVISGGFQVSQPRDPFRPLVTEGSPIAGQPGVGGTGGSGAGGGTFNPDGTTITLQEIRDIAGILRATVIVNGVSYDVAVGETFAGSYKVISLSETKGVFMLGDSAFELTVGQQILK